MNAQQKRLREKLLPKFEKLDGVIETVLVHRHKSVLFEEAQRVANVTIAELYTATPLKESEFNRELYWRGKLRNDFDALADQAGSCLGAWSLEYGIAEATVAQKKGRWRWLYAIHDVAYIKQQLFQPTVSPIVNPIQVTKALGDIDWSDSDRKAIDDALTQGYYQSVPDVFMASANLVDFLTTAREGAPKVQSEHVCLFGIGERPTIDGKPKDKLTVAQYDVIQTLIEAGAKGLNKDELVTKSGHGGAREILTTLSNKDTDWESVIQLAETTGGGYRIK